jgi:hypothetical protein
MRNYFLLPDIEKDKIVEVVGGRGNLSASPPVLGARLKREGLRWKTISSL